MYKPTLLLLAFLALAFAPAPRTDPSKEDLKKLQGTWALVSVVRGGKPQPRDDWSKVVIAGNKMGFVKENGVYSEEVVLILNATKSPKAIDLERWTTALTERPITVVSRGVYSLKGDTLELCFDYSDGARPAKVDGSKPGHHLETYKRLKR